MIVQTVTVGACTPQTIVIGRRGTYDTMQIAFDLSYLIENYGSGTAVLAVKRSQDESAYPAVVTQEDNTLTWTISETDTYYVGSGECQLMWYVDGGLAKTIIYPMVVMRDILQTAEQPPDGYENWIEHLTELGAETQQNAQNAAQSASDAEQSATDAGAAKDAANEAVLHYPKIENGYWYVWDVTAQAYQNTNIKAEGDDGYSPEVTITSIEGGHRVTITDKDHPQGQSFDVMDGQGGGGGTSDYTDLTNKPSINNVTLTGDKTAADLGLATPSDIPTDAGDIEYDESATYQAGSVGAELQEQNRQLSDKQDAPANAGTAGQVLGLDSNLDPVWVNQSGGGSTQQMELIKFVVLESDAQEVVIDTDDSSESFALNGFMIAIKSAGAVGATSEGYLKIAVNSNKHSINRIADISAGIRRENSNSYISVTGIYNGFGHSGFFAKNDTMVCVYSDGTLDNIYSAANGTFFCNQPDITSIFVGTDNANAKLGAGSIVALYGVRK